MFESETFFFVFFKFPVEYIIKGQPELNTFRFVGECCEVVVNLNIVDAGTEKEVSLSLKG